MGLWAFSPLAFPSQPLKINLIFEKYRDICTHYLGFYTILCCPEYHLHCVHNLSHPLNLGHSYFPQVSLLSTTLPALCVEQEIRLQGNFLHVNLLFFYE